MYVNILNASTGGLFVKTSTPFHPGDALKLRWRFPGHDADSEATGVVAWRRCHAAPTEYSATVGYEREHQPGAGMGVKFTALPASTAEALQELETGAR
ncbi:MAG: PilZ domain-containing protein [Deltaproteobacteria bacterium]|nr:PilZ domain-containing protein [Deltaproteobacteria bacterium]